MTMRKPAGFTTRRHRPSAAAIAYSHAHVITQNPTVAASIAAAALRRGAHSRLAVIAHARHQTLEHARRSPVATTDGVAGPDLRALATQLANTRPAIERVIVDLELRYSLDHSSFARVLGLTNARASARSNSIAQTWSDTLDPAVMAWLGPGSCEELASILTQTRLWPRSSEAQVVSSIDNTGPIPLLSTGTEDALPEPKSETPQTVSVVTISALLDASPIVHEHAQNCDVCNERLRMLTSVRSMIGQTPIEEVPSPVVEAAKTAYRRIPTPLPPSIEPHRIDVSRLRIPAFAVAGIAVLALIGVLIVANRDDKPSQADRVADLVNRAPQSNLLATPSVITSGTRIASLANNSTAAVTWNATADVSWIRFNPSNGVVQPNKTISIGITETVPTGDQSDATITITGNEGSKQILQFSASH